MTDPTARVTADDIPTEITRLVYTAPWIAPRSQNDIAELLAHYWPAIEEHFRERLGSEVEAFAKAAGPAKDPGEIGFLGGLAVAEIVVRRKGPGVSEIIAGLADTAVSAPGGER